jgi:hypothetical protein
MNCVNDTFSWLTAPPVKPIQPREIRPLVRTPKYRDDNLKKFYYAVALYQIGRITEANAVFAGLRRDASLPYTSVVRCY